MKHIELSHTNARHNVIRISAHEMALAEAHICQAEPALSLARKVAERARAAVAAEARAYVRGLEAKGDWIHKNMGYMP